MLDFIVNNETCTHCGLCAADCPAAIIAMAQGYPSISLDKEPLCYKCQHCFTVCPVGAISILGLKPDRSLSLPGKLPNPQQMELLIRGRRSVRQYKDENLEPELLHRLLEVAAHAPSGMNCRQVRFTVVDDRTMLAQLRDEVMAGLGRLVLSGELPERLEFFAGFVKKWQENRVDVIFRGAPHLLIASAPPTAVSGIPDCLIALSYFELFAQSQGVGTVWDGLAKWAINDLLPETRQRLGIPDDHVIGGVMAFGKPAIRYARTAQHKADIYRVGSG